MPHFKSDLNWFIFAFTSSLCLITAGCSAAGSIKPRLKYLLRCNQIERRKLFKLLYKENQLRQHPQTHAQSPQDFCAKNYSRQALGRDWDREWGVHAILNWKAKSVDRSGDEGAPGEAERLEGGKTISSYRMPFEICGWKVLIKTF